MFRLLLYRCDKSKSRNDSNQDESLDYFKKSRSSIVGSTPINTNDEINRLKKELDRCTTSLNASKSEIESLEKKLQSKIDENNQLKDDENNALVEVARYKEECQRLNGKLSLLDSELKYGDALEHQKKRLEELQDQIDDLQKINDDMNDECAKLRLYNEQLVKEKDERNAMLQTIEDVKRQLSSKNDELKCEQDKLKQQLEDARKECYELKNKYIEVSEAKDVVVNELRQCEKERVDAVTAKGLTGSGALQFQKINHFLTDATPPKNLSMSCTKCIDNKTLITKVTFGSN